MQATFRRRSLLASALLILHSAAAAPQQPARALPARIEDQLDSLAASMAAEIISANTEFTNPKIIVMDFSQDAGHVTILGRNLADQFSSLLFAHAKGFSVLNRSCLSAYEKEDLLDANPLPVRNAAQDVAKNLGADAWIVGEMENREAGQILVRLRVLGLGPAEPMKMLFSPTPEMREQSLSPVRPLEARSPVAEAGPDGPEVWQSNVPGVKAPVCSACPSPSLTSAARKSGAGLSETVKLSVVVTKEGRAEGIRVLQGAPYKLTEQAISAVKGWKFQPGSKDGTPVSVRIAIEIVFRTLN